MPASILSFCGAQAAPIIVVGQVSMSATDLVFTCDKYPQKSQMRSAHLKLIGRTLRDLVWRLHFGQLIVFRTRFSPKLPRSCNFVVIIKVLSNWIHLGSTVRPPEHLLRNLELVPAYGTSTIIRLHDETSLELPRLLIRYRTGSELARCCGGYFLTQQELRIFRRLPFIKLIQIPRRGDH